MTEPLSTRTAARLTGSGRAAAAAYRPGCESADELVTYVRDVAWSDLETAIRHALDETWSGAAESALELLIRAMNVAGPSPIGEVSPTVIWSGLYDTVLEAAGMECPDPAPVQAAARERAERYVNSCPNPCRDNDHFLTITDEHGNMQWTVHVMRGQLGRLALMNGSAALRRVRNLARNSMRAKVATGGPARRYVVTPPRAANVSAASIVEWPSENER